jgi:hypothetical protein
MLGGEPDARVSFRWRLRVFGNLDTHDAVCRALAKQSGAGVIWVETLLSDHRPRFMLDLWFDLGFA